MLASMKIFAAHDAGGCGYYRVELPLYELGRHEGFDVDVVDYKNPKYINGDYDFHTYDIVLGQRLSNFGSVGTWRRARTGSNRLVYENDDDVFRINPDNLNAYGIYAQLDIREAIRTFMMYSDAVTCTTEHLADVFSEYNDNVKVLPNFIPEFSLGLGNTRAHRRARIGYLGSASHMKDVVKIAEPVRRFIGRNRDWDLSVVGQDYRPAFRTPVPRTHYTPWTQINDNPRGYFQNLDFEIGLAPIEDNAFNRSKSYIKALEYNARGIPVIASNVGPYKEYVKDGVNGFLVKAPYEWEKYLNLLANDHDLRHSMSRQSKAVAEQYTIEKNWHLWAEAYEGLWK